MTDKRDMGNDAFWSVDDLTPPEGKKRNGLPKALRGSEEVCFSKADANSGTNVNINKKTNGKNEAAFTYATAVHPKRGGLLETRHQKGMLIEQIGISSWPTPYSFFEQFKRDALRFFDAEFGEEEFEPFFSFMPQFFQLNGKQLRYYLWWRHNLRNGKLLRPDYSYILLYIYEVLNLPEKIDPKDGARQLALIWAKCRKDYPRLDRYLSEWLADYCIIHNVALPTEILMPFYGEILHKTTLKEFYIDALDTKNAGGRMAYYRAILEMSSTYRFRESKAITPQNKKLFEEHIPGAVTALLASILDADMQGLQGQTKRISRDSYAGAVCTYAEKRMLDLVITPLDIRSDLTGIVTDAVRYSENCLRRGLKLRAGFQTTRLTDEMKTVLDGYFAVHFPSASVEKRVQERSYDEKYDAKRGFSEDEAKAIEEASRSIALRLGAVYEEEAEKEQKAEMTPKPSAQSDSAVPQKELSVLLSGGYSALCALANEMGVLPETLVERINAYTTELYGDILLEPASDGYAVIEDYIDELSSFKEDN